MTEARIGRVLMASLHQAIAELLPSRLDFYESWLHPLGLREGSSIALAPFTAVLSFLRFEGEAYAPVMARAGKYAAEWTVATLPASKRAFIRALPAVLRTRIALRWASDMVRDTYAGSQMVPKVKRGAGSIEIRGSVFCAVRQQVPQPLCGFYAAAVARFLQSFDIGAEAQVRGCRATGHEGCLFSVVVRDPGALGSGARVHPASGEPASGEAK